MSNDNSEWQEVGGGNLSDMWEEEAGKSIQGKLTNVKTNIGRHHKNVYELNIGNGKIVGVWGGTVLDSRLEGIALGTEVKIQFNGLTPGKGGAIGAYKDYSVFKRTPTSAASGVGAEESKSDIPF